MSSELDAEEAFFAELTTRALARAKAAPTLVEITPLADRGWRLGFRVANEHGDIVEVNALTHHARLPTLRYSYCPAKLGSLAREQYVDRVGLLLCKALERVPNFGELPPVPSGRSKQQAEQTDDPAEAAEAAELAPHETMSLWLASACDRACVFCSVSLQPPSEGPRRLPLMPVAERSHHRAELESKLHANASRAAELRVEWTGGDCLASPLFDDGLRLAYTLGYRNMGIQTPGSRLLEPGFIEFLRAHSVVRVGLTAHAADEATFDEVGGKAGAYDMFWTSFERLLADGFRVSLVAPCVAKTVDGLAQHLAELSTHDCNVSCFFWYPEREMDDTFAERGVPYARAIAAIEQLRELVPPRRVGVDGIPECVVPPELRQHFFWSYGAGHMSFVDFVRVPACERCAARDRCPGVAPVYLQHHEFRYRALTD